MLLRKFVLFLLISAGGLVLASASQQPRKAACPATPPNRHAVPDRSDQMPPGSAAFWHGNSSVGTTLWPDGVVVFKPGGPGAVLPDGALRMKFYWLKKPDVRLTVTGHRLDKKSVALRAELNHEFDKQGGQPSYLIFPTPGCWTVTATAGKETLSFVTAVTKIGRRAYSRERRVV